MTKLKIQKHGLINMMIALTIAISFYASLAVAENQKTILMLGGSYCDSYPKEITKALMGVKGVKAVDLESKPGHAIVMHDGGVRPESLIEAIKNVKGDQWYCTAEVMETK